MFDHDNDSVRTAARLCEGRKAEVTGAAMSYSSVQDILWMMSAAVEYGRKYREAPRFGPDHEMTLAFREVAERLQRGL